MAKREPYNDEVRRPERILMILAVVSTPMWVTICLVFWPDATNSIPVWEDGLIIGLILACLFTVATAVVVLGRYYAPKAVFTNEVCELTTPEIMHLEAPPYVMPEGVQSPNVPLPEEMRKELDTLAKNVRPGVNEFGQLVPWGAVRVGGWRLGQGDRWETEGRDGILLLVGNDQSVEGFENRIFTADKVLVRHEEVHPNILLQLKKLTKGWFVPYDPHSKLYRLTGTDPSWAKYYRKNPDVKINVLDELGIYGLARELKQAIFRNGGRIKEPNSEAEFSELTTALTQWLDKRGISMDRERSGPATAAYAWSLYRGAQADANRTRIDLQIAQGQITELRASLRHEDQRLGSIYSGGGKSPTTPSRALSGSLEDTQGYRMSAEDR